MRLSDLASLWPARPADEEVARFERAFAKLAGQAHAVAFPYGRTAQIGILDALGDPRPQVVCPAYTCVVVPHGIVKAGKQPVFVDVCEGSFNMDWNLAIEAAGPKTSAVLATSIFGQPVDPDGLAAFRTAHPGVAVIQDCAHGFFAGNMHRNGLAAFYGLNISKLMTSVFGGMTTTDDADFAERLRRARDLREEPSGLAHQVRRALYLMAVLVAFTRPVYGAVNRLERAGLLNRFVEYYDPALIDLPDDAFTAMGGIEARIGSRQCGRYASIVAHRRRIAEIYHEELADTPELVLPPRHPEATISHFVIRTSRAEDLKAACLARGVQLGELIDYEIPDMPPYRDAPYYGQRRSRSLPEQVINLPVHPSVREGDARRIALVIREALDSRSVIGH
ncbi:MAG: DegT/DnrJ/EryC1/StrS family aminotransferase [Roseitalea porphyridii]|uniref:DegT/DnrJ/EryC1/StrS family aminotransferase n=1 Tax=Roseitalea porphyridii TaxID=1852022 RepID=UPI0032EDA04B